VVFSQAEKLPSGHRGRHLLLKRTFRHATAATWSGPSSPLRRTRGEVVPVVQPARGRRGTCSPEQPTLRPAVPGGASFATSRERCALSRGFMSTMQATFKRFGVRHHDRRLVMAPAFNPRGGGKRPFWDEN